MSLYLTKTTALFETWLLLDGRLLFKCLNEILTKASELNWPHDLVNHISQNLHKWKPKVNSKLRRVGELSLWPLFSGSLDWPAKAPEDEAQATVWVEADGHLSGRVKLTLQLDGAAEGTGGCVRHLEKRQNSLSFRCSEKSSLSNTFNYKHCWQTCL